MSKVTVETNRPVLFDGAARTTFETSEQHRRELHVRGLLKSSGADDAGGSPDAKGLVTGSAAEAIAALDGVHDTSLLRAALNAEREGKNRKTVVDAIESALAKA